MAISDGVKLDIYNRALLILGSRRLSSLSENREPRHLLDQAWGSNDNVIARALEVADWNFATKAVKGVASTSLEPAFGYEYTFDKPDDLVRLTSLSSSPGVSRAMDYGDYADEANFWYTNVDQIYVRYVSNADDYGFDSSKWTEAFKEYVAACLAEDVCEPITNSDTKLRRVMYIKTEAKKHAKSRDAMDEGFKRLPSGTWSRSRGTRSGERG
jgi:hypothetical protein